MERLEPREDGMEGCCEGDRDFSLGLDSAFGTKRGDDTNLQYHAADLQEQG